MWSIKEVTLFILLAISVGILFLDRNLFRDVVAFSNEDVFETSTATVFPGVRSYSNCSTGNTGESRVVYVKDTVPSSRSILNHTDWFQGKLWKGSCMTVENVCYSTGRWWYKSVPKSTRQPKFSYLAHKQPGSSVGYPAEINVRPATDQVKNLTCPYSPLPNHLVLHALYNEMLGEFYARNLVGLNHVLSQEDNLKQLLESTQVYLQLWNLDRGLLDSHHAFMAPFLTHQLLDFRELLHSSACSCVERLILCGHEFKTDTDRDEILVKQGIGMLPALYKGPGIKGDDPALYKDAQAKLRQTVILGNPIMQEDIATYRRQLLESKGVKDSFDDWKILGLAQRTGRRRWINIEKARRTCDDNFRRKRITCVIVNVEDKFFHPSHHVVAHASLDGLIGIHGAQMTDALWMKPGSLVVEMLAFLPKEVPYGSWTRHVHSHTPLGVIFFGTDLYHIGLPLKFQSVPQCASKKGVDAVECIRKIKWDGRDFEVDPQDIVDIIEGFVDDRPTLCEDQKRISGDYRFVLYNVQCDDGSGMGLHHYYWDKNLNSLDNYSAVPA